MGFMIRDSIPDNTKELSLLQIVQTSYRAHPFSSSADTGVLPAGVRCVANHSPLSTSEAINEYWCEDGGNMII